MWLSGSALPSRLGELGSIPSMEADQTLGWKSFPTQALATAPTLSSPDSFQLLALDCSDLGPCQPGLPPRANSVTCAGGLFPRCSLMGTVLLGPHLHPAQQAHLHKYTPRVTQHSS